MSFVKPVILSTLFSVSALGQAPATPKPFDPSKVIVRPLNAAELRHVHFSTLAYQSSQAAYKLPQIRTEKEFQDYRNDYLNFLKAVPENYTVYGSDARLETGGKFTVLRPQLANDPWIIAIAGTESPIDMLADADLGKPQFEDFQKIIVMFGNFNLRDQEVLVTGHSLGGALAQGVAHEIQTLRNEISIQSKVNLVTWNAVGSKTMIERSGRRFNPELLKQINAYNYFIRGDLISRINHHFGPTLEIVPPVRIPKYEFRPDMTVEDLEELLRCHGLVLFEEFVLNNQGAGIRNAKALPVPPADRINMLTKFSRIFSRGNTAIHSFRQIWIVTKLTEILSALRPADFDDDINHATIQYLYNVSYREYLIISKSKDPDRQKFAPALNAELNRIRPFLHR